MKSIKFSGKIIILSALVTIMLNSPAFPQGTDSRIVIKNKDRFYIGINITTQQTDIFNEGFSSPLSFIKGNALKFSADAAFYFSKFIGARFGAGFSPYSTQIDLASYSASFDAKDNDTPPEDFTMLISGSSINESQKISFISIPFQLSFRLPVGNKFGIYLNGGVSAEIPVINTYRGTGIFSYKGYYAQYPVTLENIPDHGFKNNNQTDVSGDLELHNLNLALNTTGGFFICLGSSVQIALGANFVKSLSGISDYVENQKYLITTKLDEMNGIMEGSTETGIQSLGLSLGIRYFLK